MQYVLNIIMLIVAQVLVLGHIHLYGVVTPMLCIYLVVSFSRDTKHWQRLFLSFAVGMMVDSFANTPGLTAASMTIAAFVQPYFLELFLKKEDEMSFRPSLASMGFMKYATYNILVMFVFFFTFYVLELFSYLYWLECIIGCFGSLLITLILILTIDSLRK